MWPADQRGWGTGSATKGLHRTAWREVGPRCRSGLGWSSRRWPRRCSDGRDLRYGIQGRINKHDSDDNQRVLRCALAGCVVSHFFFTWDRAGSTS